MENEEVTMEELIEKWKTANKLPDPRDGAPFDCNAIMEKLEATGNLLIALRAFKDRGEYTEQEYREMAAPPGPRSCLLHGTAERCGG